LRPSLRRSALRKLKRLLRNEKWTNKRNARSKICLMLRRHKPRRRNKSLPSSRSKERPFKRKKKRKRRQLLRQLPRAIAGLLNNRNKWSKA